jgi:hypothetical protein
VEKSRMNWMRIVLNYFKFVLQAMFKCPPN